MPTERFADVGVGLDGDEPRAIRVFRPWGAVQSVAVAVADNDQVNV